MVTGNLNMFELIFEYLSKFKNIKNYNVIQSILETETLIFTTLIPGLLCLKSTLCDNHRG